ncbi:Metallo-dependent phosphatase-like protein, partial [Parasitella parasitica]
MKLAPSSYFCLFLVLAGLFRAIQVYYLSTRDLRVANKDDNWYQQQQQKTNRVVLQHADYRNSSERMANQPDQIFYFIQVSDLHISKFQPKGHTIHFLHFLQSALPIINPEFVVVTGDLIDAKDETKTVSAQYPQEWQVYKSAVEQGVNDTAWYDMRGNHDCFDLISWEAENNLYRQFGKSSKILDDGKGVYSWQVSKTFGNYNFVAVDSCPKKGPSRPFNFFGYLTTNSMDRLVSQIMPASFNHTFLFSHYPTTTMFSGLVAGFGEVLKTYRRGSDSLELEVADMKDHGAYRIVAVDHDLISFIDVELPIVQIPPVASNIVPLTQGHKIIWPDKIHLAPIVLITNPKDSRYTLPTKEPLHVSRLSTHIRLLIFSEFAPKDLKIQTFVDDKHHAFPAEFIGIIDHKNNMPLWAIIWDPVDFDDFETHSLRVQVTAPDGQVGTHEIPFRMDNMRVKIQGGTGEWIIWAHISILV